MSGDYGFGEFTEKDMKALIENDYNSESLRFIYDLEVKKGGSQRLTRKHKNSIGTVGKNRTNR